MSGGAIRVAAIEKTRFDETDYVDIKEIKSNSSNSKDIYDIFPRPVGEKIKSKLQFQ